MEVFIRNVPDQATENSLSKYFVPYLDKLSINVFSCQKKVRAKWATLSFLHQRDGKLFLEKYGHVDIGRGHRVSAPNATQLFVMGMPIYCTASNKPLDIHQQRSLQAEAKAKESRKARRIEMEESSNEQKAVRKFDYSYLACGIWDYYGSDLVFVPHKSWIEKGQISFRQRTLRLALSTFKIEFPYPWIFDITMDCQPNTSIMTISSRFAPRILERNSDDSTEGRLQALSLHTTSSTQEKEKKNKTMKWERLSSIDLDHQNIVSSCLVYRIYLSSHCSTYEIKSLKLAREIPSISNLRTHTRPPRESMVTELRRLQQAFLITYDRLAFPIMFQMQRLAQDGYLSPSKVLDLGPEMISMERRSGTAITVSALRKLFHQVPYRGPDVESYEFHLETLLGKLRENEEKSKKEELYSGELAGKTAQENIAIVYRATVTPAGIYLSGPEPETKNRVLRKYNDYLDYFLRVQFCDEDGQPVRYDPRISNDYVWNNRFKSVLTNGIDIAGRNYGFLGFSHSSLRSQSCWFMAPFVYKGELQLYQMVIGKLGDFSKIRCPAKCAARIGQAFSDTPNTVPLGAIIVQNRSDVERNGRVFSDGVGTFSKSVLLQIWDALPTKRLVKPTVFQIRHKGAKGMISLDSRIKTHSLFLRPSMIKFLGSESTDIEVCGAAYSPLPMFLNRQTIKILEDLGVPNNYFLDLQANAVERLRQSTLTTLNASKFLASHNVGEVVRLPWFMKQLILLDLSFHEDAFLRDVVELSVLAELRQLKHRARILVEAGATLYGIMDETGILEEGEIFIILDKRPGVSHVITGKNVIATRCPALHPGDVQLAKAVNVPPTSPLMELTNCVCFSQKGSRDLPSKLSGGDLDGDLFNLIWDKDCVLEDTVPPADYPRQEAVDIGRPVERDDMTNFFIQFMATDQLGHVATVHQVIADQSQKGTLDPGCLNLAEMHSTAVDFSKTGIQVDTTSMPRYSRCRPDFLASGPHVKIGNKDMIQFEGEDRHVNDDDDEDDDIQSYRYYESDKILGQLYRAIDEREIFRDIQQMGRKHDSPGVYNRNGYADTSLMDGVWAYVESRCRKLEWKKHLNFARDIREWYDDSILTTMEECAEHPLRPLSELEVFAGTILGNTGKQSLWQRKMNVMMKQRFDSDVKFIINNIVKDGAEPSMEALGRSVACLEVSFERGNARVGADVVSFKYVAAALCMREIDRCNGGKLRARTG